MRAFALIGLALALFAAPVQAQTVPNAETYVRGSGLASIAISPDGTHLAIADADVRATGNTFTYQIINLDTNSVVTSFQTPERVIVRNLGWLDDQRAYYQFGADRIGLSRAAASQRVSRDGVGIVTLGQERQQVISDVYGTVWESAAEPGSLRLIGQAPTGSRGATQYAFGLYRIDAGTGSVRRLSNIVGDTAQVLLGPDDTVVARIEVDEVDNSWEIVEASSGRVLQSGVSEIGDWPDIAGLLPDGRWAFISRLGDSDREVLYAFNPADSTTEIVGQHERFDVSGAIVDPHTQRVVGYEWIEDFPRQHFFDAELQNIYQRVAGAVGDGYATIRSWSRDKRRLLISAEAGEDAGAYYVYEPASQRFSVVRRFMPGLQGVAAIGRRSAITYRAADGTRIPAYLTLPATGDRNLPLVLLVHGGPHARDSFSFDPWAAYLAARGFAVLQPNFRGSTGYGHAWFNAGRGNWGDGVMQSDVNDGVDALIRSGMVDPSRVCIVGASYGGYAALAGATMTPDKYRCAVAIAGVSDLPRMLDNFATARMGGSNSSTSDWWRLSIGDRRGDRERLQQISPANLAANVRAPVLLMHGSIDPIVPVEQSRLMRDRLQSAGKQVTYIEFENEYHSFAQLENRARMLREMGDFVAAHIGQAPAQ
jgi:dipeptidyl aminopeptidase/acylaminoacyl peptidase